MSFSIIYQEKVSWESFIFVPSGRHRGSCEREIPEDSLRGDGLEQQIARFKVKYEELPNIENSLALEWNIKTPPRKASHPTNFVGLVKLLCFLLVFTDLFKLMKVDYILSTWLN